MVQPAFGRSIWIAVLVAAMGATAQATVMSMFPTGDGGWSARGDTAGPVTWVANGGNPSGHIEIADAVLGGTTYFVAPPRFLDDQSGSYGLSLSYDLRQSYSGASDPFNAPDVILVGAGRTLVINAGPNPANDMWTSYTVVLTETSGWKLDELGGVPPTKAEMQAVLENLTSLRIRSEFQNGPDTGSLDNVILLPEPSSAVLLVTGLLAPVALGQRARRPRPIGGGDSR